MKRVVDTRAVSHRTQRIAGVARLLLLERLLTPAVVVPRGTVDAVRRVVYADADGGGVVVSGCSSDFFEDAPGVQRTDPPAARTAVLSDLRNDITAKQRGVQRRIECILRTDRSVA